jgi:hypothetical protein
MRRKGYFWGQESIFYKKDCAERDIFRDRDFFWHKEIDKKGYPAKRMNISGDRERFSEKRYDRK